MSEQDRIKEGDVVSVNFHGGGFTLCSSAVVLACPCATGDSWVFREGEATHYISEGCTITKITKGQTK